MAVGKGVTLFAWTRETYLRLDKELETPSKVFQVFPLKNIVLNQSLERFRRRGGSWFRRQPRIQLTRSHLRT